jgi:hypothetical protein
MVSFRLGQADKEGDSLLDNYVVLLNRHKVLEGAFQEGGLPELTHADEAHMRMASYYVWSCVARNYKGDLAPLLGWMDSLIRKEHDKAETLTNFSLSNIDHKD